MAVGGQEHFYLESQIALAIPGADDEVRVISSTQHPSEIQTMVACALSVPANAVTYELRRMGGTSGSKETQGHLFSVVAHRVDTESCSPAHPHRHPHPPSVTPHKRTA